MLKPGPNWVRFNSMRTVFFISDRTGITAEALGNSLLTQFPQIDFKRVNLAFIDTQKKAQTAAQLIKEASETDGQAALIFSTQASKSGKAWPHFQYPMTFVNLNTHHITYD